MAAILQNGKISPYKALLLIYRMLYNSEIHQIKLFQGNYSVCWTFSFTLAESSALESSLPALAAGMASLLAATRDQLIAGL